MYNKNIVSNKTVLQFIYHNLTIKNLLISRPSNPILSRPSTGIDVCIPGKASRRPRTGATGRRRPRQTPGQRRDAEARPSSTAFLVAGSRNSSWPSRDKRWATGGHLSSGSSTRRRRTSITVLFQRPSRWRLRGRRAGGWHTCATRSRDELAPHQAPIMPCRRPNPFAQERV